MERGKSLAAVHASNTRLNKSSENKSNTKLRDASKAASVLSVTNSSTGIVNPGLQDILQDQHRSCTQINSSFDIAGMILPQRYDSRNSMADPVYEKCVDFQMQNPQKFLKLLKCPEGLEYLKELSQIKVKQEVGIVELKTPIDNCNTYNITDQRGVKIFFAREISKHCFEDCCRSKRHFKLNIADHNNKIVIMAERPFRCCFNPVRMCCCIHCRQEITVDCPPGYPSGTINENGCSFRSSFSICSQDDSRLLNIIGPWNQSKRKRCCAGRSTFWIYDSNNKMVGFIRRGMENLPNSGGIEEYHIEFPINLDIKQKAMLICNTILIDFMFFSYMPLRPRQILPGGPGYVAVDQPISSITSVTDPSIPRQQLKSQNRVSSTTSINKLRKATSEIL